MKKFNFSLDNKLPTKSCTKHWQFCVGSGHAALAKRFDYMEQLEYVAKELGFKAVRFHGIFNDDMNVVVRIADILNGKNKKSKRVYSFYQIGVIYDRLLKIGVKPFVELGFMPNALARGKKTIFHYKGNISQPKDYGEWQNFIGQFVRFLIEKYTIEEVQQWDFEVWNEPNLSCFFDGKMNDYFKLYETTCNAIKAVDCRIKVGGPATTCSKHLTEFLKYCKAHNVAVDFVSTHQYPSDALGHSLDNKKIVKYSIDRSKEVVKSLIDNIQPIFYQEETVENWQKGVLSEDCKKARIDVGNLPLYYTEWNIDSNCMAKLHDRIETSAFIVKTCLDNQGIVDGSSYWTFSDIFEEVFFFPEPFTGGFGLLNIHGIPKPSFWAFKLLSKLGDEKFEIEEAFGAVEWQAFKGRNDTIQIILYSQSFKRDNESNSVNFILKNLPKVTMITAEKINKTSGNPIAVWEQLGSPLQLKESEIVYIKEKSKPIVETIDYIQKNSSVELDIEIATNEVILLTIQ